MPRNRIDPYRVNHRARFTGQLYQLESKSQLSAGAYVGVNGPWDTYGVVQNSKKQESGLFLNLIRGCKQHVGVTPLASF